MDHSILNMKKFRKLKVIMILIGMLQRSAGTIVWIWYSLSSVCHVFLVISFLCWSKMLLLDLKDLNTLMYYVTPPFKKYKTLAKLQKFCIQKTIFLVYRQHNLPNYCTKMTLSVLHCIKCIGAESSAMLSQAVKCSLFRLSTVQRKTVQCIFLG